MPPGDPYRCCGLPTPQRLGRDVLSLPGARTVVPMAGTSDIGGGALGPPVPADQVIAAYRAVIGRPHSHDLRVVGLALIPMGLEPSNPREQVRQQVNAWIRSGQGWDAVADTDRALRDPAVPWRILHAWADKAYVAPTGGVYHPNAAGHAVMAAAIRTAVLTPRAPGPGARDEAAGLLDAHPDRQAGAYSRLVGGMAGHRRDWEALGEIDPLYAILSAPDAKHGAWNLPAFLATGDADAARIMTACGALGLPGSRGSSFELGCGVGRITRALSPSFRRSVGVDISAPMIERAREMNADRPNCAWMVNDAPDLATFDDGAFDLVVSFIVLQHVPDRAVISSYLREMARVLAPGGALVVQMPASMPLRQRIQWRRRAYHGLRAARVPERTLYDRLGLDPIRMNWMARRDVEAAVRLGGADVIAVQDGWLGDGSRVGREENLTYIATR